MSDDLMTLLQTQEELNDELADYVYTDDVLGCEVLKHPLVFCLFYSPQMNALLNKQYEQKRAMLKEAWDKGDWSHYIWLHERPYRVSAFRFIQYERDDLDDQQYWSLLAKVWVDSENIREEWKTWEELLASPRDGQDAMMEEYEWEALQALPATVKVYQGRTFARDDGWSWTTSKDTALWFARRFANLENSTPVLTEGTVRQPEILAYLLNRGESEVLVDPRHVKIVKESEVSK